VLTGNVNEGWRHYVRLGINSFATMLDLGLYVVGAALVGLGVAVLLAGFDVVDAKVDLSTGMVLVTALVLGVVGAFAMGLASEGPARRNNLAEARSDAERAISRALCSVAVGAIFVFVAGRLSAFGDDLAGPLATGIDLIRVAGVTGLWVVPLIGVPLAWGAHRSGLFGELAVETDLPIMFAVWVVGLILLRG
jgi:hypothetical protein